MKTNFSAQSAKAFRTATAKEAKGMNYAIKAVVAVFTGESEINEEGLAESIKAAKADGITASNFSADFILNNLAGTKWVSADGRTILMNKKGEMVPKCAWTAGQVVDYVRRANARRLAELAKAEKENEQSK